MYVWLTELRFHFVEFPKIFAYDLVLWRARLIITIFFSINNDVLFIFLLL